MTLEGYTQTNSEMDFTGKKILVTGAGSGIAKSTVKALVTKGAEVWGMDKDEDNLKSLMEEEEPGKVNMVVQNLRDWNGTKETLKNLPGKFFP